VAKSTAEQLRELASDLRLLADRDDTRRVEVERLRDRADADRAELAALRQENAVLRQRIDDHLKRYELWEARRWGFVMALVGAVLSLASGLIVTLARK
jgi:hypothetical protein